MSGVPNPLLPSVAGDVLACDRRERVGRDSPAGQGCRSVREAPGWGFRGPPDTTLLPLLSGASDAGSSDPNAARRSCPRSPAAQRRQVLGTAKAGRRASVLTLWHGQVCSEVQRPGRSGQTGTFRLHGGIVATVALTGRAEPPQTVRDGRLGSCRAAVQRGRYAMPRRGEKQVFTGGMILRSVAKITHLSLRCYVWCGFALYYLLLHRGQVAQGEI